MKVIQTLFLSLLGLLLSFPTLAVGFYDDGMPLAADFADVFSTLSCYCFGWEGSSGKGPERYRSGSYFGMSYHQREFQRSYNRTTLQVRNQLGRILHHPRDRDLQPKIGRKCHVYEDTFQLCYAHFWFEMHASYSFGRQVRILPRTRNVKKDTHPGGPECRKYCPEEVGLPNVTEHKSVRIDYQMNPICLSHYLGDCLQDTPPIPHG